MCRRPLRSTWAPGSPSLLGRCTSPRMRAVGRWRARRSSSFRSGTARCWSGLAVAAGTVHFSKQGGSGPLAGTSILQLSIGDGSLFVGVGGSLNASHTAVSVAGDAVGFQASGVQLDYVTAKAGDTYSALQL